MLTRLCLSPSLFQGYELHVINDWEPLSNVGGTLAYETWAKTAKPNWFEGEHCAARRVRACGCGPCIAVVLCRAPDATAVAAAAFFPAARFLQR